MKFKRFKQFVLSNHFPKGIYSFFYFLAEKYKMKYPNISAREIHKNMFPHEYIYKTRKGRLIKRNMILRNNALKRKIR